MKLSGDRLYALLHESFEREYNDTFMYLKEAALFRKKIAGGEKIEALFGAFSAQELKHADALAAKIIQLGHKPVWTFRPIELPSSLHEALERHVESEASAYMAYTNIIENCPDKDFVRRATEIRADELAHLEKVKHILKHLR